jgi:hypothetical protein
MDGLDFLLIMLYQQCIHQVNLFYLKKKIFIYFLFVGSPETNVDTSENRHDFIDKLQRLKQQVLDGIGQEKNDKDIKPIDGQQQHQIMIAQTIFTSDTSNERTLTVGNWTFECNGSTQLRIHNAEGEQVCFLFIYRIKYLIDILDNNS